MCVPGQKSIVGKETANQLAKFGTDCPLVGPESASGI
jgi:hypothetical protein